MPDLKMSNQVHRITITHTLPENRMEAAKRLVALEPVLAKLKADIADLKLGGHVAEEYSTLRGPKKKAPAPLVRAAE